MTTKFIRSFLSSAGWWSGVVISCLLFFLIAHFVEREAKNAFEQQTNSAQFEIQERLKSYTDLLQNVSAFFYAGRSISHVQFQDYVKQLNLKQRAPGIIYLNYAPNTIESTIKNTHQTGVDTALSVSIENGFDNDMENSKFSFFEKLHASYPSDHREGLMMRMPLYRSDMPRKSVEDKRTAYIGSISARFDINQLLSDAISKSNSSGMQFAVYDLGSNASPHGSQASTSAHLLFNSGKAPKIINAFAIPHLFQGLFVKRVSMNVAERIWEIEFSAEKNVFLQGLNHYLPWTVLLLGLAGTTLLYSVYYSAVSARRRALDLAYERKKDLHSSQMRLVEARLAEARLAEAQHIANVGSWSFDADQGQMTWSAETYHILGLNRETSPASYHAFLQCIPEEDRQDIKLQLDNVIRSGQECKVEHRIMRNDGAIHWVQTISRKDKHQDKSILYGTIMDITERRETLDTLRHSQSLLRELGAYQIRVKEDERRRISRLIHDELGQTLLALRIDVSMLDMRTSTRHPKLNHKVRRVLSHIDTTVKTIRTIINDLRPSVLDLGLTAAIEWQVKEFRKNSGIPCNLTMEGGELDLNDISATSLFRILQESLSNVVQHANAKQVSVTLSRNTHQLILKISDDGVGINPLKKINIASLGIESIKERVHFLNGKCTFDSDDGKGTTLTVSLPLV